jgi:phage terminase large subunit
MPAYKFLIPPHKQQIKFMNCAKKEHLFGGAKRGGKSVALCQKIIALSMAFPGNRGILIRQNLPDLKDSTLVTFFQVCPREIIARHHLTDKIITFTNGSWFSYRGVGDPDDLEKVKGIDIGWLAVDEPSEIDISTYLMLLAQLNWRLPDGRRPPYMAFLACNPEPGWVKVRFIDNNAPDREFIPSLAYDNPGLPKDYVAYLLANFPPEWVEKYVNGSWEISEGMVYKQFDRRIHVIDPLPPDYLKRCKIFGALDPAPASITAKVDVAIDQYHNRFVFWEYYRSERLLGDHAADILDRVGYYLANQYDYQYTLIDPASAQRTNVRADDERLQSIRELYAEAGLNCTPAWNSLEGGIERVKKLLNPNVRHLHPITGEVGAPFLYVCSNCIHTIDEFQGWKRKIDQNGTIKYTGPDHLLDGVRYIENSRPTPPAFQEHDLAALSGSAKSIARTHDRWTKQWDKEVAKASTAGNEYFDYLNQGRMGS